MASVARRSCTVSQVVAIAFRMYVLYTLMHSKHYMIKVKQKLSDLSWLLFSSLKLPDGVKKISINISLCSILLIEIICHVS